MNSKEILLTQERLREILHYNPETGDFTWLIKPRHRKIDREFAGTPHIMGYWTICINQKCYLAHRLAWLYMTGSWPRKYIDHKDRNPINNKWENLREATQSQNMANRPKEKTNTTGYKGVWRHKKSFYMDIAFEGKKVRRGPFKTAEEAGRVYIEFSKIIHGEFSRIEE